MHNRQPGFFQNRNATPANRSSMPAQQPMPSMSPNQAPFPPQFSDPEIQAAQKRMILTQLEEEAKRAKLRTVMLAEELKHMQIENAQMQADLAVSQSGLPQELLRLQMQAAAVQAAKEEMGKDQQLKIGKDTVARLHEEEIKKEEINQDFVSSNRARMFN